MPFPRGIVTDSRMVRIETPAELQIAAGAVELARWRHLTDPSIDGKSIRSLLISFSHRCTGSGPAHYRVRWGAARSPSGFDGLAAGDVSSQWGPMASPLASEHPATDNYDIDTLAPPVMEPRVWVTLPSGWLIKQGLRGPSALISDARVRDFLLGYAGAAVNDTARKLTPFAQRERGRGPIDWRVEVEGWLYDRPDVLWSVYIQTGDVKWLRHAHRASQYYASWIALDDSTPPHARGAFRKRLVDSWGDRGDPKYSASGGLLRAYLLTGDARLLERIVAIADFVEEQIPTRLPPASSRKVLWTEREVAVALAGALHAFEATGQARFRKRAMDIVAGIIEDIRNPPQGYPSDMHGVLLHTWIMHEGVEKPGWIMSPWMSALLAEALGNYFTLSGDLRVLEVLFNYAMFVSDFGLDPQPCAGPINPGIAPRYFATSDSSHGQSSAQKEHAYDVLGLLYRGISAGERLGFSTQPIRRQLTGLRACSLASFADGARPTAGQQPEYHLSPTRKFNWWFGSTSSMDWFIAETVQ